jgi:monoamine oxidase
MNNGKIKKMNELKKIISDELNNLFPHLNIPPPTYFKTFLWDVGYHSWKSKYNSHKVINTLSRIDGIHICGEAFSLKQGWIEGALLSADKVVKLVS